MFNINLLRNFVIFMPLDNNDIVSLNKSASIDEIEVETKTSKRNVLCWAM
jgi:hypothetical protein